MLSSLHQFFERRVDRNAAATAVVCAGETLSYGELERRANQMARKLKALGVGCGDCVGIWLSRCKDVYVTLLGIMKAGAAYVPLDPDYPRERVEFILGDCGARVLVSSSDLVGKGLGYSGKIILIDRSAAEIASFPSGRLSREEADVGPEDLAYIIYTSGTTGKPKGVAIEHRSVCHLVQAEGQLFQVRPEDRVYQGFSLAFDASVEEIWLAFFAGATLVAATREMALAGAGLARLLEEGGVTVLSCVPTLLSMLEEDVPSVRLLILGGEVCPPELVRRWWSPRRRVVNTYGPTEATVVATASECHPDKPVRIGRPLAGYGAFVLDEQLKEVPVGVAGELCLGGVGLARGYVGRPELTQEKFIWLSAGGERRRLYRTGDRVRQGNDGELEFLGRIDTQVKIRGFRVELGEIEAALLERPEVKAATAALREGEGGCSQLAAYIVLREGEPFKEDAVRRQLRLRLPAFMVPAWIEVVTSLPTLPSGKVDRQRLPVPRARVVAARPEATAPRNPLEQRIAAVWAKLFAPVPVSVRDDFFLDLGGHSLLAARMVSELRRAAPFEALSMLDVYRHSTIEELAAAFTPDGGEPISDFTATESTRSAADGPLATAGAGTEPDASAIPFWRHFWCGAAQLVSLAFVLTFYALQWLTPYLTYTVLIEEEHDFVQAVLGAFASLILFYPIMLVIPILVKWLVIGRYRAGQYPLWGTYYFRWWLVTTIEAAVPVGYLTGSPLLNVYLRLMGAKIGRNVHLDANSFFIYDLLEIGDDSSINVDANLLGCTVENGFLKLGSITLGRRCFVGARATLREDTVMEDDAALEDLSLLPRGGRIPCGETWVGSPAKKQALAPGQGAAQPEAEPSTRRVVWFGFLHGMGLLLFPVLVSAALFPGIVVMNWLNYLDPYYWYLLLSPLVGVSFIVLLCLEIAGIKWLLLGRVKPATYRRYSLYYLRKWFVDQTLDLSLDVVGPLYASVYLTPWYKLLGAKLGYGAEISTASFISPDLLTIGAESFIADSVSLGAPRVRNGWVTIGPNRIGERSFVGNSALLPPGTVIGDNVLIGCLSVPPVRAEAERAGTSWLGSPAIFLPERQKSAAFAAETTFSPTPKLRVQRAIIEFVRVITPSTCFVILLSLLFSGLLLLHDVFSLGRTLLFFPLLYFGCAAAATLITIAAKWALVWRYRPGEKPLWSTFVWRNELLNALHEHLAEPFLVGPLTGTPFVCWYFRLLGARIGRRVYMGTTDFSEFDLAHIGDEVELNQDCTIQTHLFEDRVMKMSTVDLAARSHVGAGSLVLYDTRMEAGARLGDLSLLMKGEVLPAGTIWQGIPARRIG